MSSFHRIDCMTAIVAVILAWTLSAGAEGYPSLYRGELHGNGIRIQAHFRSSFLKSPAEQQDRFFRAIEEEIKGREIIRESDPKIVEPETLPLLVIDDPGAIFYVLDRLRFYPARAKGIRLKREPVLCGERLTVTIDAEWVTDPDLPEKESPPPFLHVAPDPDGPLIFKGRRFESMEEFFQTKFQPIRFPEDLPEGLKPRFHQTVGPVEPSEKPLLPRIYAPETAFLPIEVGVWQEDLPDNGILLYYYRRKGEWTEVLFSASHPQPPESRTRVIGRFDLDRNGRMEYLIETQSPQRTDRLIYELDDLSAAARLLTRTDDTVIIEDRKSPGCQPEAKNGITPTPSPSEETLPPPAPASDVP